MKQPSFWILFKISLFALAIFSRVLSPLRWLFSIAVIIPISGETKLDNFLISPFLFIPNSRLRRQSHCPWGAAAKLKYVHVKVYWYGIRFDICLGAQCYRIIWSPQNTRHKKAMRLHTHTHIHQERNWQKKHDWEILRLSGHAPSTTKRGAQNMADSRSRRQELVEPEACAT